MAAVPASTAWRSLVGMDDEFTDSDETYALDWW